MDVVLSAFVDAAETGLAYMLGFLGIWIAFRVHHAFDLTVGGSFTAGGAITAVLILGGADPWISLPAAIVVGGLAGMITFLLHRFLGLRVILASIITNTALISVNLVVMGSPNLSLFDEPSIIANASSWLPPGTSEAVVSFVVLGIIAVGVAVLVGLFLNTEEGLAFRMSGINDRMARSMGVSPEAMLMLALVMANGLAGLSGSLVAQQQGFADLHMGDSLLIFGITGVLIGEILVRRRLTPVTGIVAVVAGTYTYRLLIALAFRVGITPQLFNLLTAGIVTLAIAINVILARTSERRSAATALAALTGMGTNPSEKSQ